MSKFLNLNFFLLSLLSFTFISFFQNCSQNSFQINESNNVNSNTEFDNDSNSTMIKFLGPNLIIIDKEIHYPSESSSVIASARPLPIPKDWDAGKGGTGNAFIFPKFVTNSNGVEMEVFTSTSPGWLFKKSNSNRLIQIANVMKKGSEETLIGVNTQSIWYRISTDGGESFSKFKPIIQNGHSEENPFPGIVTGKNGIWPSGVSTLIELSNQSIVIPVSYWPLDSRNEPTKQRFPVASYSVGAIITGNWNKEQTDLSWTLSDRAFLPESKSTRGVLEPAVQELKNKPGTLIMVSRGSNEYDNQLPSRRWISVSNDYGKNWSQPEPLCNDDGSCYFSSSTASNLIRAQNGKLYWIGPISEQNSIGNFPRDNISIAEINENSLKIIKKSILTIDSRNPEFDSPEVQIIPTVYLDNSKFPPSLFIYSQRFDPPKTQTPYCWYQIGFSK